MQIQIIFWNYLIKWCSVFLQLNMNKNRHHEITLLRSYKRSGLWFAENIKKQLINGLFLIKVEHIFWLYLGNYSINWQQECQSSDLLFFKKVTIGMFIFRKIVKLVFKLKCSVTVKSIAGPQHSFVFVVNLFKYNWFDHM